ncbi:hypothetical protein AU210_007135 [Fusarium oxysporum f. sp. radicis-cucumerinum]|uniref:Uncharacterized protein n=1 Tax=Fusarium oxysporum f. sp. radicis-cucumerinum TaxID=327505 RepID=A0A2H3HG69_FUSOX|nr:hypothetical protein HZ326_11825 [Fusarium oxysporum f. sp. albedinis]PCD38668.1 hypothetical protein AU210_007135 [Fusarium oxysporum f. sp. radicis-cucumerinum]
MNPPIDMEKYYQANVNNMRNLDNPIESENMIQRLSEEDSGEALILKRLGWVIMSNACVLLVVVNFYLLVKMYAEVGGFSCYYCHWI